MKELTGYKTAQVVNEMISNVNVRTGSELKAIPPQMVYNYIRKGYITANPETGKVPFEEAERWGSEYIAKKLAKVTVS